MWRDAALVAGKDLRVELRSRVTTNQVAPYALLVLLLFGFAFDQNRGLLTQAAPGLFWVAVLLCALLAVQRSFSLEAGDGARDGLRLSGLDTGGIFLGKAGAVATQLAGLEVVLAVGIVLLFGSDLRDPALLVLTCLLATVGLAAAGTVYGVMAAGLRVRETLLPLLVLPVVAPVLLGAFAVVYLALGVLAFGS
ncbi:MAG TPA: heme exporter protein CcmB, partial [Acidimicrobiales bacterium]|nr:heme exporter protein CcmB [Acidimicrobiales bacterium]